MLASCGESADPFTPFRGPGRATMSAGSGPARGPRFLFPYQCPRDGARIPTLAAVLNALPDARLIVEVKTDPRHPTRTARPDVLVDAVLAEVDRAGATGRVVMESFDWRIQRHLRRVRPDRPLAFLTRSEAPADPWWAGVDPKDQFGSTPASVAAVAPHDGLWAPLYSDLPRRRSAKPIAWALAFCPGRSTGPRTCVG